MTYNPKENYCSFSPDSVFGVKINYGCYIHDRHYRDEMKKRKTRLEADNELYNYIVEDFKKAGKPRLGRLVGIYYWMAVRFFCGLFWMKSIKDNNRNI